MPSKYENYITGDDAYWSIYAIYWRGQTFTVGAVSHTITSVKLLLFRLGSPGTVTVSIRETAAGVPTGVDKTSGTIDGNSLTTDPAGLWYEIALTEYTLSANTMYAIVVRAAGLDSSNVARWRVDQTSPAYGVGTLVYSQNSGVAWTSDGTRDFLFEVWGNAIGGGQQPELMMLGVGLQARLPKFQPRKVCPFKFPLKVGL